MEWRGAVIIKRTKRDLKLTPIKCDVLTAPDSNKPNLKTKQNIFYTIRGTCLWSV